MALQIEKLINEHKVRDWTHKNDVQNDILNDIEDYLFSIKGRYDIGLDHNTIDKLMNDILTVAKRRELNP